LCKEEPVKSIAIGWFWLKCEAGMIEGGLARIFTLSLHGGFFGVVQFAW
jgi:hypothetical protein